MRTQMTTNGQNYNGEAWTRRDFVKTSAAAAAAGILVTPVLSAAYGEAKPTQLKVGLIGCGGRGSGAAIQALNADKHAVLFAMADAFKDRLDQSLAGITAEMQKRAGGTTTQPATLANIDVPAERQFVGFDAYQKVIDLCDVVILTEPPHFRPAHLRAAVEAGKHVFCEKPIAVDAPGVRSVLQSARIAREKNLALVSGFCWRYSAREREAFTRLHNGGVGDIRTVYTTYNCGGWVGGKARQPEWTDMEFQLRNWHYFTWLSGDHIVEQACHAIDRIAWAMSDKPPVRCTAVGGRQVRDAIHEPGNAYDHFAVTYEYENGARAFHMCRHFPNTPFDNSDYILGTRGTCTLNSWGDLQVIEGDQPWKCQSPKNDMYQQEHDELFASIRAGKPINDGERMANSTMMAIMGRMAAYTGQVVTWDQAMNSTEDLKPAVYEWGELPTPAIAMPGLTKVS